MQSQTVPIEPGRDHQGHIAPLYNSVAASLEAHTGEKVNPKELVPINLTRPVLDHQSLIGKKEEGVIKTTGQNKFLKVFLERLFKKNPGKVIEKQL